MLIFINKKYLYIKKCYKIANIADIIYTIYTTQHYFINYPKLIFLPLKAINYIIKFTFI